jgi:hypothetical protein
MPDAKIHLLNNKKNQSSITLLIKFPSLLYKDIFMSQYFKLHKDLTLDKIGIESKTRFYIHHNLTSRRYQLYKEASHMKKNGKISSVNISGHGQIAVKLIEGTHFVNISTKNEMTNIINNSTAATSSTINNSISSQDFSDANED